MCLYFFIGCLSSEILKQTSPARWIARNCDVELLYGDELAKAVLNRKDWNGGKVPMGGQDMCLHNAIMYSKYAKLNGIEGTIRDYDNGNHVAFTPRFGNYYVEYQVNIGTVVKSIPE